jgi:DNA-directed RNA polymerase subunit H (RpoH/RPB5)
MDCFIKKIFDGKTDELVHVQFQKFSRGEFKDKAVIIYSNSKGKYSLSTTYEYANEFSRALAEKLGNNKTMITGVIVSTRDLTGQINFKDKKQFAGVKQYVLESEMSGDDIISLINKMPTAFFALSFKVGDIELKTKPKAPISGKPSTKSSDEQEIKADFCKLYTNDLSFIKQFVFDSEITSDTKKAQILNHYSITNIEVPKGETDPLKMRENAIRKGKIIRTIKIEDKIIKKEHDFSA